MSDLESAIAAEMLDQRCHLGHGVSAVGAHCAIHPGRLWDGEFCPTIERYVRAGWNAAINAAAEKAQDEINQATQDLARIAPSKVGRYHADGGLIAGFHIRDAIAALLSKGGDRD